MISSVVLFFLSAAPAACPAGSPVPLVGSTPDFQQASELGVLYRSGREFEDFLATAKNRRDLWLRYYREGAIDAELLERARSIPGRWRILAIAEDNCIDSVNTIPFLALLAERVPGFQLRVVDPQRGRQEMVRHLTPDFREATPTILILDEEYDEVGCWVERPAELQAWALDARRTLSQADFLAQLMAWHTDDAGRSTIDEIVSVVAAAAIGSRICEAS